MNRKILLVDDDVDVLAAYQRNLRKHFVVKTAIGATEALELIKENDDYAVIVSDYSMPDMNGIDFLSAASKILPDTVRIIITGYADLKMAIDSINEINIYKFLTKPVPMDKLINHINDAAELHRLITSEKDLLDKTLKGSIKTLTEILAAVQPIAFNQASQIRVLARKIAEHMGLRDVWEIEIATMLSQIGCVTVPIEILEKKYSGFELTREEERIFSSHPELGKALLSNIPRLENISEGIAYQGADYLPDDFSNKVVGKDLPIIARILKVVNDFDFQLKKGLNEKEALKLMQVFTKKYDPLVLKALIEELAGFSTKSIVRSIPFRSLRLFMVLADDIRDDKGNLLISKGTDITDAILLRLISTSKVRTIAEPIKVYE